MGKTNKYKEHLLKSLEDPNEAAAYLDACLEDDDPHVFLLALKDVAEACEGEDNCQRNHLLTDIRDADEAHARYSKEGGISIKKLREELGL